MEFTKFRQKSGFKVLAMARLSQCEYSITLYLINCLVSGLKDIVSTESELAELIGYEEDEIIEALKNLAARHIIQIHYKEKNPDKIEHPSMHIAFQYETEKWKLNLERVTSSSDAIVYPFPRYGAKKSIQLIPPVVLHEESVTKSKKTWQRLLKSFSEGRNLEDEEVQENEHSAKLLVETHPVDQILLLLHHFKKRIPSLSLLASNWEHYQELFEQETSQVNLTEARVKHAQMDEILKKNSKLWLKNAAKNQLSAQEITILKLLIRHRHPRRQLFWAYQARSRYTNLKIFFEENSNLMLGVTGKGVIVRKNPGSDN